MGQDCHVEKADFAFNQQQAYFIFTMLFGSFESTTLLRSKQSIAHFIENW